MESVKSFESVLICPGAVYVRLILHFLINTGFLDVKSSGPGAFWRINLGETLQFLLFVLPALLFHELVLVNFIFEIAASRPNLAHCLFLHMKHCWNTVTSIHLPIMCDCSYTPVAELRSCGRGCVVCKVENVYSLAFYVKNLPSHYRTLFSSADFSVLLV